jgi:ribosome-binding protein aMBF1 (putative translation factor)
MGVSALVGILCPIGALEAQTAPGLKQMPISVSAVLQSLYGNPSQRDRPFTMARRDTIIRARHAAGVSQAELARQFGISYQRIHQIVHERPVPECLLNGLPGPSAWT